MDRQHLMARASTGWAPAEAPRPHVLETGRSASAMTDEELVWLLGVVQLEVLRRRVRVWRAKRARRAQVPSRLAAR